MQHVLAGVFFYPKRLLPYEGRLFFLGRNLLWPITSAKIWLV
ncbi:MAG: hypothetical protein ACJAR9_000514 [Celeribacter sp.]|jgi:hypothetical protein